MEYIQKTENENKAVSEIIGGWGSDILVSRGKIYRAEDLEGILVYDNEKIIGLGLYDIMDYNCEIVLLETFVQNEGIGTQIIDKDKRYCKREELQKNMVNNIK